MIVRPALAAVLAVLTMAATAHAAGDRAKGREVYTEKCVLCHGGQGGGWDWQKKAAPPPVPVPDLAEVTPQRSDQYLFEVVKNGSEGVGRTRFMPAFGFQLSDEEIWHVVAYVRSLGAPAKP